MSKPINIDMLGHETHVGDRIAAAFDRKGLPEMRVGTVVSIYDVQATVEWEATSPGSTIKGKTTNISLGHQRYIVLTGVNWDFD